MTAKDVFEFLKPSLEKLTHQDREELCNLISGGPKAVQKKKAQRDPIMSIVEMKKRLLKSHFKSKEY